MPNSTMTDIVRTSSRVYSFLLHFYPPRLRCRFGAEMADVFEEQLRDAFRERGARSGLSTWYCATEEIILIALPARLESFVVPAVSLLLSLLLIAFFFSAVAPTCHGPK
jgi:hypothetical protein